MGFAEPKPYIFGFLLFDKEFYRDLRFQFVIIESLATSDQVVLLVQRLNRARIRYGGSARSVTGS